MPALGHAAVDAGGHDAPDLVNAAIERRPAAACLFIGALHGGNGQARSGGHGQHVPGVGKGVGHVGLGRRGGFERLEFLGTDDKAAADGIIDAAQQQLAIAVKGGKLQAIGMTGQGRALVKHQIDRGPETIAGMAGRVDHAAGLDVGHQGIHGVRIDGFGVQATQAQRDCATTAMADAGKGQRAMQAGGQRRRSGIGGARPVAGGQLIEKAPGCRHRSHGVGTRWADADFENVEYGQEHDRHSGRAARRRKGGTGAAVAAPDGHAGPALLPIV